MKRLIVIIFMISLSLFGGDKSDLDKSSENCSQKKSDKSEDKMRVSIIGKLTDDIKGKCGYHINGLCLGLDHENKLKDYLGSMVFITGDFSIVKDKSKIQSFTSYRVDLLNIEIKTLYHDYGCISGENLDGLEVTVYGVFNPKTDYIGNFDRDKVYVFSGFHILVTDISSEMLSKISNKTVILKGKLKKVKERVFPAKSSSGGRIYSPYKETSRVFLTDLEIIKVE